MTTTLGTRDAGAPVRLQLRLDGAGDWYVVIAGGDGERHAGTIDDADATLVAHVDDWRAVQAGTLDRLAAFLDGKLKIDGDLTLFMLHEQTITRLTSGL